MKKFVIILWLSLIFSAIVLLFWYSDFVYGLPTPIPKNYTPIFIGKKIPISSFLKIQNHKLVLLHFFNPDCPCSKFNVPHFISLEKQYSNRVQFAIVVMSKKIFTAKEIQQKFNITVPVLFDTSIAKLCGVYSTPQAVIIDEDEKLFYRGNYNASRYCTNKKSNYAQQALDSLLLNPHTATRFNRLALTAYGCSLPHCPKQ